jgi:hypothetical protein
MKSIAMDVDTVSLVMGELSREDVNVLNYDGANLNGPDLAIDRVSALDLASLRKESLLAYAAARRYAVETASVVMNGVSIATDRQSQAMLSAAYNMAQADADFSTMWKGSDGSFAALSAAQIIAIAQAVGAFVASCFAAEAAAVVKINAGTITTKAEIDAAIVAQ